MIDYGDHTNFCTKAEGREVAFPSHFRRTHIIFTSSRPAVKQVFSAMSKSAVSAGDLDESLIDLTDEPSYIQGFAAGYKKKASEAFVSPKKRQGGRHGKYNITSRTHYNV